MTGVQTCALPICALARVNPLKKMDDGEYREKLGQRLEVIEREKSELARELDKLEALRKP